MVDVLSAFTPRSNIAPWMAKAMEELSALPEPRLRHPESTQFVAGCVSYKNVNHMLIPLSTAGSTLPFFGYVWCNELSAEAFADLQRRGDVESAISLCLVPSLGSADFVSTLRCSKAECHCRCA